MLNYRVEDVRDEAIAREREVQGGLAASTRALVDAVIRSTVDDDEIVAIRDLVDELTARLTKSQLPEPFGVSVTPGGTVRAYGNAVVGLRNAIAPPLVIRRDSSGRAESDFTLGAAYEGPPGMVHGGVTALLLDQLCGEAAAAGGSPGMTATLSLHYLRPTPLGEVSGAAWIDRTDGVKTFVKGTLADRDGVTVECEGLFILPRWAREAMARDHATAQPPKFE